MTMTFRATILAATLLAPVRARRRGAENAPSTSPSSTATASAINDLTAADLVVKEGGKERDIVKAGPASAKMRLTLAVEERLMADAAVRQGMFAFMKRVIDAAEIRLVTIGLRNTHGRRLHRPRSMPWSGPSTSSRSIRGRSRRSPKECSKSANEFVTARTERPVLVVLAISGRAVRGRSARSVWTSCGRAASR